MKFVIFILGIFVGQKATAGNDQENGLKVGVQISPISGSAEKPRRHLRFRNPANLSNSEAERIYTIIRNALADGYGSSKLPEIADYQNWQRFNSAPYLSATHGNHYLNNYGNELSSDYATPQSVNRLPVGSVLAKDSFSITDTREIILGPLAIMTKMPSGFNRVTGDWKYMEVRADGSIVGETNGKNAAKVDYCIACHLARGKFDHLYFVPEASRN